MSRRSPARRFVGLLGAVLVLAGIAAAVALFVLGPRARDAQIDDFARGVVGCTTPLVFTETGTFYVYEEVTGSASTGSASCPATPRPGDFGVEIDSVTVTADDSVTYERDAVRGASVARFEVTGPGTFDMTVHGPDAGTVAAVGPDPGDVVDSYRQWALIAGIAGVVLGLALLIGANTGRPREDALVSAAPAAGPPPPPWPPHSSAPLPPPAAPVVQAPPAPEPAARDPWGAPTGDDRRG